MTDREYIILREALDAWSKASVHDDEAQYDLAAAVERVLGDQDHEEDDDD